MKYRLKCSCKSCCNELFKVDGETVCKNILTVNSKSFQSIIP